MEKKKEGDIKGEEKAEATADTKVVVNEKRTKKPRSKNRERLIVERKRVSDLEDEVKRLNTVIEEKEKESGQGNIADLIVEYGSVVISKEEVGRGAYGVVYKGDYNGTEVAVKGLHKEIVSPHYLQMLEREIHIASQCRHPNLLQFMCAIRNPQNHLLIVTELMDMALRTLVAQHAQEQSRLEYHEVRLISLDVARGLNYLHSKKPTPIIHRDINSGNVLLWMKNDGTVGRAKIADYGTANLLEACKTANPGTLLYAAPEATLSKHNPKIDVFSYGVLVCEMFICEQPEASEFERRNQIEKIVNDNIKTLVNACVRRDPKTRPMMDDVIEFWQRLL